MAESGTIAYISGGRLYLHDAGEPKLVESAFVQQVMERAERARERDGWKSDSMGWNFKAMRGLPPGDSPSDARRVEFTAVAAGAPGRIVYCIQTDHTCGLFEFEHGPGYEQRLFHRQQFRARDLARRDSDGMLALSFSNSDGTSHIATMAAEGRGLRQVTEGDVVDEHPTWDGRGRLVYHSAGIARNAQGSPIALGPYSIVQLDLDSGAMETLLEDPRWDCLAPRVVGDATYYIRRPYEPRGRVSGLGMLRDALLFPWRLGVAVVHFLNFFSLMFSKKPLITSGGPLRDGPDQRRLMLWGRMIDAQKALRQRRLDGALVPREWELVRRSADGDVVIARSVVAYDADSHGPVWTDGSTVFRLRDGRPEPVCRGSMIQRLAMVR